MLCLRHAACLTRRACETANGHSGGGSCKGRDGGPVVAVITLLAMLTRPPWGRPGALPAGALKVSSLLKSHKVSGLTRGHFWMADCCCRCCPLGMLVAVAVMTMTTQGEPPHTNLRQVVLKSRCPTQPFLLRPGLLQLSNQRAHTVLDMYFWSIARE